MHGQSKTFGLDEEQLVPILTILVIGGVIASIALGGVSDALLQATYYITNSGAAAGGAAGGVGAVAAAGISSSSATGLALAGAVTGGAGLVVGAAA